MPNVAIPTSLVGNIAEGGGGGGGGGVGGHSPNHNSMISSQILGSTPLNQIGCTLPIDPYAGCDEHLILASICFRFSMD